MRLWRKLNSSVRTKLNLRLASVAELSHCTGRSVGSITEYSGTYKRHFCVMFACTSRMHRDRKFRLAPEGLETRRTGCAPLYPTPNTSRMRPVDDLQEVEKISMKGRYPLSLALAKLPQADGGNSGFPLLAIVLTTLCLRSSNTRCWKHRQPHSHLYAVRKCCMPYLVGIYPTAEVLLSLSHRRQFLVTKTGFALYAYARQHRLLNL